MDGGRVTGADGGVNLVFQMTLVMAANAVGVRDFVVVTTNYPHEELRPQKVSYALTFFAIALGLELFSDVPLAVSLLVGALGMIISGVLTIDEAYSAVSWKTVFLLASLIPLGQAMENSGAAAWIASQILALLDGVPIWVLQTVLALLATVFSLLMSNVGATVMLVPLAMNLAIRVDADPAVFALTVTMATANAFLIPTNQVNALIIGPGGYRVKDFVFAGGIMTLLFLPVMLLTLNWLY
jgi:di/tricarboxylate transporter